MVTNKQFEEVVNQVNSKFARLDQEVQNLKADLKEAKANKCECQEKPTKTRKSTNTS